MSSKGEERSSSDPTSDPNIFSNPGDETPTTNNGENGPANGQITSQSPPDPVPAHVNTIQIPDSILKLSRTAMARAQAKKRTQKRNMSSPTSPEALEDTHSGRHRSDIQQPEIEPLSPGLGNSRVRSRERESQSVPSPEVNLNRHLASRPSQHQIMHRSIANNNFNPTNSKKDPLSRFKSQFNSSSNIWTDDDEHAKDQFKLIRQNSTFGGAALQTVNSFRFGMEVMGDLVVPRVKCDWAEEIQKGGAKISTTAFVVGFLLTLGLALVFLLLFSKMEGYFGIADDVYIAFSGLEHLALPFYITGGGTIFLFYVLDFYYAPKYTKLAGFIFLVLGLFCIMAATFFLTGTAGAAPMALFFVLVPLLLLLVKILFFQQVDSLWYLLSIALALLVISIVVGIVWLLWFFVEAKKWNNEDTQREYFGYVDCNFTSKLNIDLGFADTDSGNCPEAFIVYSLPMVISTYCFLFANVLTFTIRAETRRREQRFKKRVEGLAQIFIVFTVLGVVACWVLSSLFAAQVASVSTQLLYLSVIFLVTVFLVVVSVFGYKDLREDLMDSPLGIKVVELSDSDWASAFCMFLFTPILLLYLLLSFITQCIRKYTPLGKPLRKEFELVEYDHNAAMVNEYHLVFKVESQWVFYRMSKWEWGSVLHKILLIGVFWFIAVIGIGRVVNVFFSWLSEVLSPLSLGATTGIFIFAGLAMFMLPPVPGLPIYLTGGIVLSENAQIAGLSFAAAGWYSVLICSIIKMLSIVIQQKFIGQWLGSRSVYIRSICNVNSLELRAMKKIMSVPGWSIPKVAVLVGGPDWPTSVLTGIMRLSLWQMLIGSIPVLLTIVPVSFAGAVLIQGSDGVYASLNAVLLSVSVVVQLSPFFVAMHYIAKAAVDYKEEIESQPKDAEVEKYDIDNARRRKWATILNRWKNLSWPVRIMHILMCVLSVISNMTFQFAGDYTFESFEVTDTIEDKLSGNVFNLIKRPFGLIMVVIVFVTFFYVFIFGCIQGQRVKYRMNNDVLFPVEDREEEGPKEMTSFFDVRGYSMRLQARSMRVLTDSILFHDARDSMNIARGPSMHSEPPSKHVHGRPLVTSPTQQSIVSHSSDVGITDSPDPFVGSATPPTSPRLNSETSNPDAADDTDDIPIEPVKNQLSI